MMTKKEMTRSLMAVSLCGVMALSACRQKAETKPVAISWPEAVTLIRSGDLHSGWQNHDRSVGLVMKDGRTFTTVEPELDGVYRILKEIYPKGYPEGGFPKE
jgi:urease gamma subunit